jgi:uncharacterized protein (TIGR00369 family)
VFIGAEERGAVSTSTSPGLLARAQQALDVPLQHELGATLTIPGDVNGGVSFAVAGIAVTPAGSLHAGALSGIMELAAYLAVLPTLAETEHAVTHAYAAQFLAPAYAGEIVEVTGTLLKRGRTTGFCHVRAHVGDREIAQAQITKSVISLR